ncbi:hypothetical protein NW765_017591 [Fusarium oxysporum]|nr:hypothetical protein NW765_017591 [Fusarium oxysporum]KAJ4263750.1 hypothetical protein NW764_016046 [Fusarium oxysporum]
MLPHTVAKNESDYGSLLSPVKATPKYQLFPQDYYKEGLFIDYRHFDHDNIEPRFELGFGLTYTTFKYENLVISAPNSSLSPFPEKEVVPGGHEDLWDTVATVSAEITNTKKYEAAEISQLYVRIPADGQAERNLRGIDKVLLSPGSTKKVTFQLRRRELSDWDIEAQQWRLMIWSELPDLGWI